MDLKGSGCWPRRGRRYCGGGCIASNVAHGIVVEMPLFSPLSFFLSFVRSFVLSLSIETKESINRVSRVN